MAKRRRPKLAFPEGIDAVIERSGEDRFAPTRPPISARVWSDAVGARIADRAKPVVLERGVLTVRAATSVWASELSLLGDALVARLRSAGVSVTSLRFRVGPVEPPPRPAERRASRRVPAPVPLEGPLAAAVADVPDDELRDVIAHAARANLAWQRQVAPPPATGARPAVRAPRDAGRESDPPARTSAGDRGAARRTREGG